MTIKFTIEKKTYFTEENCMFIVEEKENGYSIGYEDKEEHRENVCEYSIYDNGTLIEHKVFSEDSQRTV